MITKFGKQVHRLLLKPGPGPWTLNPDPGLGPWTRTLKNIDPEEPGP